MNVCYSESEARSQVGAEVVTVADLPEVPVRTSGRVVGAHEGGVRGWLVCVKWDLPPRRSEVLAQFCDLSFNLPWRMKRPVAEFSKTETEHLLRRVER